MKRDWTYPGKRLVPGILLLLTTPPVSAVPVDPAGHLADFFNEASRLTDALIGVSTELARFSELEWTTFAVFALVIVLIKWTMGAAAVKDVVYVVLMILIARFLMQSYETVLAVLWEITTVLSDDISQNTYTALNLEATGIRSTGVFLLDMLIHVLDRITIKPAPTPSMFFSMFADLVILLRDAIFVLLFFCVLLVVFCVSWVISAIGLWSLLIGKVLGPIFIPFLIFKRSSSYFDGWLNFMLGSFAYLIVAQINLAFTSLIFIELFESAITTGQILTLEFGDILRLLNYIGLLIVAVLAMLRTDKVVSDLMQGGASASGAISQSAALMAMRLVR